LGWYGQYLGRIQFLSGKLALLGRLLLLCDWFLQRPLCIHAHAGVILPFRSLVTSFHDRLRCLIDSFAMSRRSLNRISSLGDLRLKDFRLLVYDAHLHHCDFRLIHHP